MKEIIFTLSNGSVIRLSNVIEVMGHDDSLPFNAVLYIKNGDEKFRKVANVWNDGWGGFTNIDTIGKKEKELCDEIDKFLSNHYESHCVYNNKTHAFEESLESMINTLAYLAIDCNARQLTKGIMKHLDIYEKELKKEVNVGDIVEKPIEITKQPGVWEEIDRKTNQVVAKRIVTENNNVILDAFTGEDITFNFGAIKKKVFEQFQWKLVYKFEKL